VIDKAVNNVAKKVVTKLKTTPNDQSNATPFSLQPTTTWISLVCVLSKQMNEKR
jgi:hypothetical protein